MNTNSCKIAFFVTSEKHIEYISQIRFFLNKETSFEIYSDRKDLKNTVNYEKIFVDKPDIIILWMAYPKKSVLSIQWYCLRENIPCRGIQEVHQMGLNKNRINHYFTPLDGLLVGSEDEKKRLLEHHIYTDNISVCPWPFIEKNSQSLYNLKQAVLFLSPLQKIDLLSLETELYRKKLITKTLELLQDGWRLIIKPHPLEKFSIIKPNIKKNITIEVADNLASSIELIKSSAVVFNYGNSQVCIEALGLGKPLYIFDFENDYLPLIPDKKVNNIDDFLSWYQKPGNLEKVKSFVTKTLSYDKNLTKEIAFFIEQRNFNRNSNRFALHLAMIYLYTGNKEIAIDIINNYFFHPIKSMLLIFIFTKKYNDLIPLLNTFKKDIFLIWVLSSLCKNKHSIKEKKFQLPPPYYIPFFWNSIDRKKMSINTIKKLFNLFSKLVKFFYKNYFLKKKYIKKSFSPEFLVFPVTYRCNLSCVMCTCPQQAKEIGELDINSIENALRNITNRGQNSLTRVNLTGGELFLRKDLESIVELLTNYGTKEISISSNGYAVDLTKSRFEALLTKFPTLKWSIQLSIDGDEENHNLVRKNPKAFINTFESLKELKRLKNYYNFTLSVNVTISPTNIKNIQNVENYISELKLPFNYTYAVNSDLYIDSNLSDVANQLSDNKYKEELIYLSNQIYNNKNDLFSLDIYLMLHGYKRFTPCVFYHSGYFLEPSGNLYKCSVTEKSLLCNSLNNHIPNNNEIKNKLNSINSICNSCFNNCGNSIYSNGYIDFIKSDFIQTRKNIYLSTSKIDYITPLNLKKLGLKFSIYSEKTIIQDDDLILYTSLSNKFKKNYPLIKLINIPVGCV